MPSDVVPWACSYRRDGRIYGITLWATDPSQVLEDWCDTLQDLEIVGVLLDEFPGEGGEDA